MIRLVVALAAYNEAEYLRETIPAILNQSMADFRLVAIDNGSTDETSEILHSFDDPRMIVDANPENLIGGKATNFGLRIARQYADNAQWVLFHGADDLMLPGYLEAVMCAADEHPEVNCIFSPFHWMGQPERGVQIFPPYDPPTIARVYQIPAWKAITWDLWDAIGEDESVGHGADWDWAVRASVRGLLRPYQLEQPYLSLRVRPPGRVTSSLLADMPALRKHMQRHLQAAVA